MGNLSDLRTEYLFNYPQAVPVLADWHHHEWGEARKEELTDSTRLLNMCKSADRLPLILVAYRGEVPVGMAMLIEHDIASRKELTPWLAAVYVPPAERGKGIGSLLASKIVGEARRLGHKRLYLFTQNKLAFYERLGWKLSEIFPYRNAYVAIMRLEVGKGPFEALAAQEKSGLTYAIHLHNYIYGLKKEAEERGKSILTAAAVYTASLVWFIKFATDVTSDSSSTKILTMLSIGSGGVGFLFVIWSIFHALKTFSPQVVDASSPMEPLEIAAKPLVNFETECSSMTEGVAKRALAREIYAVSTLQIRRSSIVLKSSRLFALALVLLVVCVLSIIGLYLTRRFQDLGLNWVSNIGRIVDSSFGWLRELLKWPL